MSLEYTWLYPDGTELHVSNGQIYFIWDGEDRWDSMELPLPHGVANLAHALLANVDLTALIVSDSPKMLRETLCEVVSVFGRIDLPNHDRQQEHLDRLGRLIAECDRHRPLGPDGNHNYLHTSTCGCEGENDPPDSVTIPLTSCDMCEPTDYSDYTSTEGSSSFKSSSTSQAESPKKSHAEIMDDAIDAIYEFREILGLGHEKLPLPKPGQVWCTKKGDRVFVTSVNEGPACMITFMTEDGQDNWRPETIHLDNFMREYFQVLP